MLPNDKLLFSEGQVNQLVEAKVKVFQIEERLRDAAPQTVEVDVKVLLTKLKEMEQDVVKKHQQAVRAWRKAFNLYTEFLKKNPGSQVVNSPGAAPKLGDRIENIRAFIRGYEAITPKTIKLGLADWIKLFHDASQAVAEMRAIRDNYVVAVSGLSLANLSTSATNFVIR